MLRSSDGRDIAIPRSTRLGGLDRGFVFWLYLAQDRSWGIREQANVQVFKPAAKLELPPVVARQDLSSVVSFMRIVRMF
jgi:hypothetical protein